MRKLSSLVMLVLLLADSLSATHYYVATTGSDAASGLVGFPWLTIDKGANTAVAGDTVHVAAGTYTGAITSDISGSAGNPITFICDVKWTCDINNAAQWSPWKNTGAYVIIKDFDIQGGGNIGVWNDSAVGHVQVIGNLIHDVLGTAAAPCGGSDAQAGVDHSNYLASDNDTLDNTIVRLGNDPVNDCAYCIYHATAGGKIQNNICGQVGGWGIHLWHGATDVLVTNNLVFNAGFKSSSYGCIIVGAGDAGEPVGGAQNVMVRNNITINCPNSGIWEAGTVGTNTYTHNTQYNTGGTAWRLLSGNTHSNDLTTDPLVVNYQDDGTGDYHSQSGSPSVNSGTATNAPATDLDGRNRPIGGTTDRGPYEYGAQAAFQGGSVSTGKTR